MEENSGENLYIIAENNSVCMTDNLGLYGEFMQDGSANVMDAGGAAISLARNRATTSYSTPKAAKKMIKNTGNNRNTVDSIILNEKIRFIFLKLQLAEELKKLCPQFSNNISLVTGTRWTIDGKEESFCCSKKTCEEQADKIANAYVNFVYEKRKSYIIKHGIVPVGGWRGNLYRNTYGDDSGSGEDGLLCTEWAENGTGVIANILLGDEHNGIRCFRIATVGKPVNPDSFFNHCWIAVYGPFSKEHSLNNIDLALDPWPNGGETIISPKPYKYIAKRMDTHVY